MEHELSANLPYLQFIWSHDEW